MPAYSHSSKFGVRGCILHGIPCSLFSIHSSPPGLYVSCEQYDTMKTAYRYTRGNRFESDRAVEQIFALSTVTAASDSSMSSAFGSLAFLWHKAHRTNVANHFLLSSVSLPCHVSWCTVRSSAPLELIQAHVGLTRESCPVYSILPSPWLLPLSSYIPLIAPHSQAGTW